MPSADSLDRISSADGARLLVRIVGLGRSAEVGAGGRGVSFLTGLPLLGVDSPSAIALSGRPRPSPLLVAASGLLAETLPTAAAAAFSSIRRRILSFVSRGLRPPELPTLPFTSPC